MSQQSPVTSPSPTTAPAKEALEWVTAKDLIEALKPASGGRADTIAICRRAHAGLLRAKAALFKKDEQDRKSVEMRDADLPKEFWWAEGHAALDQDWQRGDFATWIESRDHWRAFGVTFNRQDAEAMGANFTPVIPLGIGSILDYAGEHNTSDRPLWDWLQVSAWLLHRSPDAVNGVTGFRARAENRATNEIEAAIELTLVLKDGKLLAQERSHLESLCLAGTLAAKGRIDGGDLAPIPADAWDDSRVYQHRGDWWLAPTRLYDPAVTNRTQWSGLRFDSAAIRSHWPPESANGSAGALISNRTGAAGRPTAMHIIESLMRARAADGSMLPTLAAESEELAKLFKSNQAHNGMAPPTAKTIRNSLGSAYRALKQPET